MADVRQAVRYAVSDMKGTSDLLPGFCLPKGIVPILPIFREAILNGDGDEKEAAAQGKNLLEYIVHHEYGKFYNLTAYVKRSNQAKDRYRNILMKVDQM